MACRKTTPNRVQKQRLRKFTDRSKDLKSHGSLNKIFYSFPKMTTTGGDDITLAPENDHDNDSQSNSNVNLDGHNNYTGDTTAQATAAGGSGGSGPTNFNLQVEQNKIPEFFGAKSKDTISAVNFIQHLEDLAKTNRWTDAQTYHHFANSPRNPALEWLSSIVDWSTDEDVRLVWSDFKDLFKQEYAV